MGKHAESTSSEDYSEHLTILDATHRQEVYKKMSTSVESLYGKECGCNDGTHRNKKFLPNKNRSAGASDLGS